MDQLKWDRNAKSLLPVLFLILIETVVVFAAPLSITSPKMLQEGGDCLNDEILAFQRLRAERRTVLENDDSAPMVGQDNDGRIYLVSRSGKLLTSNFGGESFTPPQAIMVSGRPLTDVQAFGVLRSNKLLIAYGDRGQLWLARSEDGGRPGGPGVN